MSKLCRWRKGKQQCIDSRTGKPAFITKSVNITDELTLPVGIKVYVDYTQIMEGVYFTIWSPFRGGETSCGHVITRLDTRFCAEQMTAMCQHLKIGSLTQVYSIIRREAPELDRPRQIADFRNVIRAVRRRRTGLSDVLPYLREAGISRSEVGLT